MLKSIRLCELKEKIAHPRQIKTITDRTEIKLRFTGASKLKLRSRGIGNLRAPSAGKHSQRLWILVACFAVQAA